MTNLGAKMSLEVALQDGDVVWARMSSYPWWPAMLFTSFEALEAHNLPIPKLKPPTSATPIVCFLDSFEFSSISRSNIVAFDTYNANDLLLVAKHHKPKLARAIANAQFMLSTRAEWSLEEYEAIREDNAVDEAAYDAVDELALESKPAKKQRVANNETGDAERLAVSSAPQSETVQVADAPKPPPAQRVKRERPAPSRKPSAAKKKKLQSDSSEVEVPPPSSVRPETLQRKGAKREGSADKKMTARDKATIPNPAVPRRRMAADGGANEEETKPPPKKAASKPTEAKSPPRSREKKAVRQEMPAAAKVPSGVVYTPVALGALLQPQPPPKKTARKILPRHGSIVLLSEAPVREPPLTTKSASPTSAPKTLKTESHDASLPTRSKPRDDRPKPATPKARKPHDLSISTVDADPAAETRSTDATAIRASARRAFVQKSAENEPVDAVVTPDSTQIAGDVAPLAALATGVALEKGAAMSLNQPATPLQGLVPVVDTVEALEPETAAEGVEPSVAPVSTGELKPIVAAVHPETSVIVDASETSDALVEPATEAYTVDAATSSAMVEPESSVKEVEPESSVKEVEPESSVKEVEPDATVVPEPIVAVAEPVAMTEDEVVERKPLVEKAALEPSVEEVEPPESKLAAIKPETVVEPSLAEIPVSVVEPETKAQPVLAAAPIQAVEPLVQLDVVEPETVLLEQQICAVDTKVTLAEQEPCAQVVDLESEVSTAPPAAPTEIAVQPSSPMAAAEQISPVVPTPVELGAPNAQMTVIEPESVVLEVIEPESVDSEPTVRMPASPVVIEIDVETPYDSKAPTKATAKKASKAKAAAKPVRRPAKPAKKAKTLEYSTSSESDDFRSTKSRKKPKSKAKPKRVKEVYVDDDDDDDAFEEVVYASCQHDHSFVDESESAADTANDVDALMTPLSMLWNDPATTTYACRREFVWDHTVFTDSEEPEVRHFVDELPTRGRRNVRSVQHSQLRQNFLAGNALDPHMMVECAQYATPHATHDKRPQQPFRVCVHPDVAFVCDLHAHLAMCEIIGYFGGKFDREANVVYIHAAFPCRSMQIEGDDGATDVEMDPASELEVRQLIEESHLDVVGWYHSHPTFAPDPSIRDIENQASHQELFNEMAHAHPFVGLIVGTYDAKRMDPVGLFRYFHVRGEKINGRSKAPLMYFPFELAAKTRRYKPRAIAAPDASASPNVLQRLRTGYGESIRGCVEQVIRLLAYYKSFPRRTRWAHAWQRTTKGEKLRRSLLHHVQAIDVAPSQQQAFVEDIMTHVLGSW
ncbi:hypothetical protein, variant [Saprolegnia diclina VS20]|uniref:MPN domain-containing protein n=1 Tax=Saprolegnia diclina (strain VS20) TaxID=1156394 RepID=T0PQS3_SAPDV|nr:hypothetical protein, variant [Saprolegnia diclina VS20]EQC27854.1 hypothetical protein, variant [Saprolegnia diclina VS20]|eukprot:XP_008618783.1 hypothetical protein, variant [Saprolegnia diclina VS20]